MTDFGYWVIMAVLSVLRGPLEVLRTFLGFHKVKTILIQLLRGHLPFSLCEHLFAPQVE